MIKNVLDRISLLCVLLFLFSSPEILAHTEFSSNKDYTITSSVKEPKSKKLRRSAIVKSAKKYIGTPYRYGGKSPAGFDCSGFTGFIRKEHGISLGANSRIQAKQVQKIPLRKAKPGDLIFFSNRGKINHVAIVQSKQKGELFVIHSTSSSGVRVDEIMKSKYWRKRIKFAATVID